MKNQLKNQFLILGLTGPLGSGCSMTAKFLSGEPCGTGITIKELLQIQAEQLEKLDFKIKEQYKNINNTKQKIKNRLSKRLGHHKQDWVDPNKDNIIKGLERKNERYLSKLKIYLNRREVHKSLRDFLNSGNFDKKNINDLDKETFGLSPFCYISFTTIIIKLAFEQFIRSNGKSEFDNYFLEKICSSGNKENKEAYQYIQSYIIRKFEIDQELEKTYVTSNKFIKNRAYQFPLQLCEVDGISESLKNKFNQNLVKAFKTFYDFISFIRLFLDDLKGHIRTKGTCYTEALSEVLQDWGDNVRNTGNPFTFLDISSGPPTPSNLFLISDEINILIKAIRFRVRYLDKSFSHSGNKEFRPDSLFVIECFRNPYEVEFFRSRYAEFYLLSISAKKKKRKARVGESFSQKRDRRDEGKGKGSDELYKLDVTSCVLSSDIAILNDYDDKQGFLEKFLRYFSLIRTPGCIPPSNNELYMHIAYSHSLKSTCISRKVGAVILGPKGYILGAGWNAPGDGQIGCGLRIKDDLLTIGDIPLTSKEEDLEKFKDILREKEAEYICYKDIMSKIYTDKKIFENNIECQNDCLNQLSSQLDIKRLEYCRALHAEENAILQSAKVGGMPIENGTIYTTTYPCELCAKKLYQIGVRTIYYTEPYPESISEQVFLEDGTKVIERIAFEGVKSHSYYRLFKPVYDKKDLPKVNF